MLPQQSIDLEPGIQQCVFSVQGLPKLMPTDAQLL
jgi:hypothetical protein